MVTMESMQLKVGRDQKANSQKTDFVCKFCMPSSANGSVGITCAVFQKVYMWAQNLARWKHSTCCTHILVMENVDKLWQACVSTQII